MIVSFFACRKYIFDFDGFSMERVRGARSFFTIHVVNNSGLIIITLFNGYFLSAEELAHVNRLVLDGLWVDVLPATIVTDTDGRVLHIGGGVPSVSEVRRWLTAAAR